MRWFRERKKGSSGGRNSKNASAWIKQVMWPCSAALAWWRSRPFQQNHSRRSSADSRLVPRPLRQQTQEKLVAMVLRVLLQPVAPVFEGKRKTRWHLSCFVRQTWRSLMTINTANTVSMVMYVSCEGSLYASYFYTHSKHFRRELLATQSFHPWSYCWSVGM